MLDLIALLIVAGFFAIFATQNTDGVAVQFAGYSLKEVPLYLVVLASIFLGVIFSSIIALINGLFNSITNFGKDTKIQSKSAENKRLENKLNALETENEKLRQRLQKVSFKE